MIKDMVTLQLNGATCTSCVFALERVSRRIQGLKACEINGNKHIMDLYFIADASDEIKTIAIETIQEIVRKFGYSAYLVEE